MAKDFVVNLSPEQIASVIIEAMPQSYESATLLDDHRVTCASGTFINLIFTRFFFRVGGFATLVVTISDVTGVTVVRAAMGGHRGWFGRKWDLGTASSFIGDVERALAGYVVEG